MPGALQRRLLRGGSAPFAGVPLVQLARSVGRAKCTGGPHVHQPTGPPRPGPALPWAGTRGPARTMARTATPLVLHVRSTPGPQPLGAFRPNVLCTGPRSEPVLMDWAFVGLAPVGEETATLFAGSTFFRTVPPALWVKQFSMGTWTASARLAGGKTWTRPALSTPAPPPCGSSWGHWVSSSAALTTEAERATAPTYCLRRAGLQRLVCSAAPTRSSNSTGRLRAPCWPLWGERRCKSSIDRVKLKHRATS